MHARLKTAILLIGAATGLASTITLTTQAIYQLLTGQPLVRDFDAFGEITIELTIGLISIPIQAAIMTRLAVSVVASTPRHPL